MRSVGAFFAVLALSACQQQASPSPGHHAVAAVRGALPDAVKVQQPRDLIGTLPQMNGALRLAHSGREGAWLEVRSELAGGPFELVDGMAVRPNAKVSTDLVFVSQADGIEELRVLRPGADGRASYDLRLGAAWAEARLFGDRVEVLAGGRVALQTSPIVAVDAAGTRRTPALRLQRLGDRHYLLEVALELAGLAWPIVLDPKWTTVSPLNVERSQGQALLLPDGRILLADGPGLTSVEEYNPKSNVWTLYPVGKPHYYSTLTLLDSGKVLIAGGAMSGAAEVYDPSTHAAVPTANDLAVGRSLGAAAKLPSGKVLIAGGTMLGGAPTSSVELYDPTTSKFTNAAPLTPARTAMAAITLPSGKILVVGRQNDTTIFSNADLYEPITNSWTSASPMLSTRSYGRAALIGGKVFLGGGSGPAEDTVDTYDPVADKWTRVGSFKTKRLGSSFVFGGGTALLMGGINTFSTPLPIIEVLDLSSGAVADGPALGTFRVNMAVSPLADGRFIAAGGDSTKVVEIFDPAKTCTSPTDCLPGEGCSPDGLCKPKADNGAACSGAAFCKSGNCVDGVCCDKACSGACEACTATLKGGGVDGVCANVAIDTDPKSKCAVDAGYPVSCKADGLCDGSGVCRAFAKPSTACGATTCTDGKVSGQLCNGSGTCAAATATSCGAYKCDAAGTACRTKCASDLDCAVDHVCAGEACVPKAGSKADGQPCSDAAACKSGNCVDGVCCNVACGGQCQACDVKGKEGTCAVVAGPPHSTRPTCGDGVCAGTCDGVESLKCSYPKDGEACGTGGRCAKGVCADGDAGVSDGGTDAAQDAEPDSLVATNDGCGCDTPGRSSGGPGVLVGLLLALGATRRRLSR